MAAADSYRCYHSAIAAELEENLRLLSHVKEDFELTATDLDSAKRKVKIARIGCVAGGTAVGVASAVGMFFTAGVTAAVGAAAVGGVLTTLMLIISKIVSDILKNNKLNDLESKWTDVKGGIVKEMNIPRDSKEAITQWAKTRLSTEKADAVAKALEKSEKSRTDTERLKHLDSKVVVSLLESLLSLIAVDFSVFEILVGALKEKDDPGDAIRNLTKEMGKYEDQLKKKLMEEREKEKKHSVKMMLKLGPDEPREYKDNSVLMTPHNTKATLEDIKKENIDTPEENLLSSYSTARTTQTESGSVKTLRPPVFCKGSSWQVSGSFSSEGGMLCKEKSDVVLSVPPDAVASGEYVDVYESVSADVEHIQRALKLDESYFVASPMAEFWARGSSHFKRPVEITLPHCLPKGIHPSEVIVFRATRSSNGRTVLHEVPNQMLQDSKANNLQKITTEGTSIECSYTICDDKTLVINTTGFSSYVCVHCKRKNKISPTLLFVGAGANKCKTNTRLQTASIHVHVWDERLDVRDFLEEIAPNRITDKHHLTLCRVLKESNETMAMTIGIIGENASAWRHLLRASGQPGFAEKQTFKLSSVLGCDNKNCSSARPVTIHWMLETMAPSHVAQWLQCVVDIIHVPSQSSTSLALELEGPRGSRGEQSRGLELRRDVLMVMDPDQLKTLALGLGVGETTIRDIWRRFQSEAARKVELVEYLMEKFESGPNKKRTRSKRKSPSSFFPTMYSVKGKTKLQESTEESACKALGSLRVANMSSPSEFSDTEEEYCLVTDEDEDSDGLTG